MSETGNQPAKGAEVLTHRKVAAPNVLPETQAYWDAANEGKLLLKKCEQCHKHHYYPRDICPFCLSAETVWDEVSGQGTVYSFSTMGTGEAAYTLAYVTLTEGPSMLTNIVGCEPQDIRIGQNVEVVFVDAQSGQAVPMFRPVGI